MSTTLAVISAVIAVASFGVSIFVLWRQHLTTGRAHFTADWETTRTLVFINHGPGAAREVTATLRSSQRGNGETMTIPYIGPFQPTRMVVIRRYMETLGPLEVTWRDNRRTEQSIEIHMQTQPNPQAGSQSSAPDLVQAVRAIAQDETKRGLDEVARQIRRRR